MAKENNGYFSRPTIWKQFTIHQLFLHLHYSNCLIFSHRAAPYELYVIILYTATFCPKYPEFQILPISEKKFSFIFENGQVCLGGKSLYLRLFWDYFCTAFLSLIYTTFDHMVTRMTSNNGARFTLPHTYHTQSTLYICHLFRFLGPPGI